MALPSMRVGDVEVQGISDGILKTSLDLVIGMDARRRRQAGRRHRRTVRSTSR